MTNRDPYDARDRGNQGWSAATLGAFAFGALLALGGIMYAMSDRSSTTATAPRTTTSAPTTTGQGDNAPAPATPAPRTPVQ